jgi:hypothetical protein
MLPCAVLLLLLPPPPCLTPSPPRCGTEVRYVIDFYNAASGTKGSAIGMHLDVRPALDSVGAAIDRLRALFL